MKIFKANDLYIIRPMTLVQVTKHIKLKLPKDLIKQIELNENSYKMPLENTKQTYLSLADNITIAEDNKDSFISVIDNKMYPKYSNKIISLEDSETAVVHPNYVNKVSEILFQERSKSEGYNISFKDFLNSGIYESLMNNLDKIAEEIINQEFDIDKLKDLAERLKAKEKDKFIIINRNSNNQKVYERAVRKRKK